MVRFSVIRFVMVRFGYGSFWLWDETSSSLACLWSVVLSGYSNFFHHENWSPRYSWNIAESGVITHKKEFSSCWFWMSVDSFLMSSFILSQLAFIWILFAIMRSCYGIGTYDGMVWVDNMRLHRLIASYSNIDESWKRTGPSMRERAPGFDADG